MIGGFSIILAAQFFSALADNALLFAAIALLKSLQAPEWQTPVLQDFFVFAYIVLAPFVGVFSDAMPKGRVMLFSNTVKMLGCAMMMAGMHPLLAYGIVGIGAAMYSPAKYGILAEYLPADKLVWANAWMEGLTVAAIILGAVVGGFLISPHFAEQLSLAASTSILGAFSTPIIAVIIIFMIYGIAALVNLYIPNLPIEHQPTEHNLRDLLVGFWQSFWLLWKDPLGQVSLGVTSLFWGSGTTLRFIILVWAASALQLDLAKATQLTAVVAVGLAIGSFIAAKLVPLEHAVKVLPVGMLMGLVVMLMTLITDWRLAIVMLMVIGGLAGYFVIPMNALLQHRGHKLMGSGHSIAVQNFNENLAIALMLGAYALMVKAQLSINTIIIVFGLFMFFAMGLLYKVHGHDQD